MRLLAPSFAALVVAGVLAVGSAGQSSAHDATFRDAVGEDTAGPDITRVRVSNDDEGRITFGIALPNRPTLPEDLRLSIFIDADDDVKTGVLDTGMDYRLLYDFFLHGDRQVWLLTCKGSVCSSLGGTKVPLHYAGGPTITIDRSELRDTHRFRFWITVMDGIVFDPVARTFDLTNAHGDTAPDAPAKSWAYDVRIGPSKLLVQRFSTMPAKPVAGKTFVARLKVKRDDTGATISSGRVTCKAAIAGAGAGLQGKGFARGAAFCSWKVPAGSSGRTLRGSIAVAFSGKTARRSFALKVS
jgi:hypothetical protein